MPSDKRQRQDEGRLTRLEGQQTAARRSQRIRQFRNLGLLLGALVVVAFLISVFSGDDKKTEVSSKDVSTTTTTTDGAAVDPVEIVLPGAGASITGETPCPEANGSSERTTGFEQVPPTCIDPGTTYTATLDTTEGTIVIELDADAAPETVNNFVVLSRYHFYDNVPFHRIIPGFMNQAGDPVGPTPGTGGPGYTIADEPPDDPTTAYAPGAVAMAKTSAPDSGGSQFFLVIGDANGALAGNGTYSVFGKIIEGQDVSEAINQYGDAATDGTPTKIVAIKTVTITES